MTIITMIVLAHVADSINIRKWPCKKVYQQFICSCTAPPSGYTTQLQNALTAFDAESGDHIAVHHRCKMDEFVRDLSEDALFGGKMTIASLNGSIQFRENLERMLRAQSKTIVTPTVTTPPSWVQASMGKLSDKVKALKPQLQPMMPALQLGADVAWQAALIFWDAQFVAVSSTMNPSQFVVAYLNYFHRNEVLLNGATSSYMKLLGWLGQTIPSLKSKMNSFELHQQWFHECQRASTLV